MDFNYIKKKISLYIKKLILFKILKNLIFLIKNKKNLKI